MKQYITAKQLKELSRKEELAYLKWVWDKGYFKKTGPTSTKDLPLLSMGQMLEFLDEKLDKDSDGDNIEIWISQHKTSKEKWLVQTGVFESFTKGELCDALWEVVKEILEK